MFFRFGSAVALVVLISVIGTALEKENLALRRRLSHQHYRTEVLLEENSRLRLEAQQIGAPARLIDSLERGDMHVRQPEQPVRTEPRKMPLLNWR